MSSVNGRRGIALAAVVMLTLSSVIAVNPLDDASGYASAARETESACISLTYTFSSPVVTFNGGETTVTIPGLPGSSHHGHPVLPVKPVNILLPYGHDVASITVTADDYIHRDVSTLVHGAMQVPLSAAGITDASRSEAPVQPAEQYTTIGVHTYRGYAILTLLLRPVAYNAGAGTLSACQTMTVTVTTRDTGTATSLYRGTSEDMQRVAALVDNPDTLTSYTTTSSSPHQQTRSSLCTRNASYDYVIITTEALNASNGNYTLHDLVYHYTQTGINATVVTVEDIIAEPGYWNTTEPLFNDTQAQIRNFITDAYLTWNTTYVLLAGDADAIPPRKLYASADGAPAGDEFYEAFIPADCYYGCLDGTWNSDLDLRWGENATGNAYGEDEADFYAEVYVGRAPVDSAAEVANFVKKTLAYANATDDQYLENVLMVGEYLGFGGVADYGGNYKDETIDMSTAHNYTTMGIPTALFNISTLYDRDWPGFDPSHPYTTGWPKATLIQRLNNGVHLLNHLGHGSATLAMKLSTSDVDALNNTRYPFIYSQACYAGAYDNQDKEEDCFAEHLTVKTAHGAVAAVMNTRLGWGAYNSTDGASQRYDREFWDAVYNESVPQVGKALQDAKEDNVWRINESGMRWSYYELTLFGDPALRLHAPPADATPPVIRAVEVHPSIQEPGEPVNISAVITDNILVDAAFIHVTFPNGSSANVSLVPTGSGDTYTCTVQYDTLGGYTVNVSAVDATGNTATSSGYTFRVEPYVYTYHFSRGWNVVSMPVQHNYTAKQLGAVIDHCTAVAQWNASTQGFRVYLVGISPDSFNFAIEQGKSGFEVWVAENSTLTVGGVPYAGNKPLEGVPGWNLVGWYNATPTLASEIGAAMDNATIISKWNATLQQFTSFLVGISPPSHDFVVARGMAVYVFVRNRGGDDSFSP